MEKEADLTQLTSFFMMFY